MNNPVLILYLEDNPRDAELVRDTLQQASLACELRVASDRAEYEAALAQTRFDLILSDYNLPDYDGMAALALAREKQPDVPFILISGTLGEEQAVDCVLRGATDYVLKQRLDRLVPAVLRALTEAEEHRKRREAEESLRASEVRYRRLFEAAKDGILILDAETGMVVDVNPFLIELLGYSHEEFLGKKIWELGFFKDIVANQDNFAELQQKEYVRYEDMPLETSDGRRIEVEFVSNVYLVNDHKVIQCNIRDITERKRAEEQIRGQLEELQRWQDVMLDREDRVQELKREVNELCRRTGEAVRYPSEEASAEIGRSRALKPEPIPPCGARSGVSGSSCCPSAVAVLARKYLLGELGTRIVWVTFYPAVVVASFYGGWLAGLLSAGASCLVALHAWPLWSVIPSSRTTATGSGCSRSSSTAR